MRRFLAFLVTALALQAGSAFALVGGPWDNHTNDGNNSGTFTAVMTMRNGSGIAKFAQGAEAQVSPFSESVVYYRGIVYFGTCFGNVDFASRSVTGITNGTSLTPADDTPTGFCNTQWSGKVTSTKNTVTFQAKGDAVFFGDFTNLPLQTVTTTVVEQTIDPVTQVPTFTQTTETETEERLGGGPNGAFPTFRTRTKVFVYGARTSFLAQGISNFSLDGAQRVTVGEAAAGGGGEEVPF